MQDRGSSERQFVHVIKASAGSGKTHRLTGEYLRLLFAGENNYKHILAVTFTNKATDEMKSRIVEELYKLSSGAESGYLNELIDEFSLTEVRVRQKARAILETILHDYSAFSITTIDRFFQQTMRAFTREMGLSGGYNIEVDETPILMETIDFMLAELDKPENKALSQWLLLFMQEQIEEGKSWKIDRQVQDLASELLNETYKSFSDEEHAKIRDKEFLLSYQKTLVQIVRTYEKECKNLGAMAVDLMDKFGLNYQDFKWGKGSGFLLFPKLASGIIDKPSNRLRNLIDNIELWYGNKSPKEPEITNAYHSGLNDVVKQTITFLDDNLFYNTALSILRNFYTLGILNDIKTRLHELQQENNTLFLSDTTELLNDIISDSDSPFIYEKTGTRLNNYMIDEFQDTSRMQWQNFLPLMRESLASNNFNLIVGDVKQSIYRFRNSDWRLLEEQVSEDFGTHNVQQHVLDTNWRSDTNIIQFNNAFFTQSAMHLQNSYNAGMESLPENDFIAYASTKITDAYEHVHQLVPESKQHTQGQVKITFLQDDKENDIDWKADALARLPLEIESLQEQGFALKDIAIVVRWNNEAVLVAETLLQYKEQHPESKYRYDVISNEALVIGNAQSVKAAIALMRHIRNPKDETRKMMAVYEFYRFHKNASPDESLALYRETSNGDFPEEFRAQIAHISSLPFYEMVEAFFALSEHALNEKENAYVQAFLDIVLKFSANSSSNLNHFLDWWDEKGYKKTLFSPDGQDAIRLITIHKSKGLGFDAVIMPFVHWSLDHIPTHNDIIWCKPTEAPFNEMSVLPLKYGKALANTIFRDDYWKEKLYTYIDNLNLLYVAFTRTKNRLIAFAPTPKKPDNITCVSDILWKTVSESSPLTDTTKDLIPLNDYFTSDDEESVFELGEPMKREKLEQKPEKESFLSDKWQSIPFDDRLKLRLNSIGFFSDDGSRAYGTLMHDLISRVKTIDNLPDAVAQKVLDGELPESDKDAIFNELSQFLSMPEVANWYSDNYTILNETQLLHPIFGFSRPDRVMIGKDEVIVVDYKFGELEERKHERQVLNYVKAIEEMGFANVKGFVFYVKMGKVFEV